METIFDKVCAIFTKVAGIFKKLTGIFEEVKRIFTKVKRIFAKLMPIWLKVVAKILFLRESGGTGQGKNPTVENAPFLRPPGFCQGSFGFGLGFAPIMRISSGPHPLLRLR